jgi:hypothetical protein
MTLRFELGEDDALFVDSVRQLGRDRIGPAAAAWDEAGRVDADALGELAQLGLLGLEIPEAEGGAGLSTVASTAIVEELAAHSGSLALVVAAHNFLTVAHVLRWGTEAQRSHWLPKLAAAPGAWALSERGSGSDAAAARTHARRQGDGWVLSGAKSYITAGRHAGAWVVFATTEPGDRDAGLTAFLVDGDATGLSAQPVRSLGMRGCGLAHVTLSEVAVGDDQRLGAAGSAFADAQALLDRSRIGIAALACGLVSAALSAASTYACQRHQFGRPIAAFQAIQWKLADMATGLDAARAMTMRAAWLRDAGRPFAAEASRAKVYASDLASRACSEALQVHGGYGYTREFPVERLLRDAKATQIAEGTNQIQRVLVARAIADRFGA